MMKIFISILVIGGIAFGGYVYLQNKENKINQQSAQIPSEVKSDSENMESSEKKIAFSEFIKKEGSYECDIKATGDFGSDGKAFISDGKIRGDFNTISEGISVDSSVLVRDGFTYVWSATFPQAAVKVQNVKTENSSSTDNSSGVYFWNAQQVGDYNCYPWEANEAKFTIPANITFKLIK